MNVRRVAIQHLLGSRPFHPPAQRHPDRISDRLIPSLTYVICTNPRSGSWLLCEGLTSSALAGNPREWFNVLEEQDRRALWRIDHATDLTFEAYLRLACRESMTKNGVSGIKMHYYQFTGLPQKMATATGLQERSPARLVSAMFPDAKYVWLRRRDKVRQAISLYVASQTNQWWSIADPAHQAVPDESGDVQFDPAAIAEHERLLERNDDGWQRFFETSGIDPLVIDYEDFASNYSPTIANTLKWLEIPGYDAVSIPPPRLRRQCTQRSEDWVGQYCALKREHPDRFPNIEPQPGRSGTIAPAVTPLTAIPTLWKQWVAQAQLSGYTVDAIAEALAANGYSRDTALREARTASADPYLLGSNRIHQRTKKAATLLSVRGQLRRLNSQPGVVDRKRQPPSRQEFLDEFYAANRPVIIEGLMADWKALTAWTPQYLTSVAGDSDVEVMAGRSGDPRYEVNADMHRTPMRFASFIDMVDSGRVTNDYYLTATNGFFQRPGTSRLLDDAPAFPQYLTSSDHGRQCFLWFGPAGTVTPLHHDTSNILMAQVKGRKRYRLIPPEHCQYLYNSVGVFSDVDCEAPDLTRHPDFRHATVIDVVLEPGEVLFMPVGWWHHVRALDVSMTITFTNFVYPNHFSWE
ncbi:MAG: Stf0 family sulfotransferase [Mycobacterium sp.]